MRQRVQLWLTAFVAMLALFAGELIATRQLRTVHSVRDVSANASAAPTTEPSPTLSVDASLPPASPSPLVATAAPSNAQASTAGCPMFPADNFWHADVSQLPVHPRTAEFMASIGLDAPLHPDFGAGQWDGGPIGIPYTVVGAGQRKVRVSFKYADESDPGPYPIPRNAPIEGGPGSHGDRHVIVLDRDACQLYELYAAYPRRKRSWKAGSGAIFDLRSNAMRPEGWTSADAAGLAILPGLVRYDEVTSGVIDHAIRFTASTTDAFVWPARHKAGQDDLSLPPMGLWVRLKASVDITPFPPNLQVILRALRTHGMILADNGSPWFISGTPDSRWNDGELHRLGEIKGSDFEAVDVSSLIVSPDSGGVRR